jgi:tRNA(Ile)-lysidine synthetase-like protein
MGAMQIDLKFLKTVHEHRLIPSGSRIVVAVSGGADSLALLHLLHTYQGSLNCTLHVATLDHGIRGGAGADDVHFVVETAQAWGLAVTTGKADVPILAKERGLGIETAARIARYDFLAEVAQKVGAGRIAVAHHADDQAETVLMHLLRGAGLEGLTAMDYSAPLPGHLDLTLIRPLLDATREETEFYCRRHLLHPRHDTTNDDTTYIRNRLRREIIPKLRAMYPQVKQSLIQLSDIAAVENDFVDQQLQDALISHTKIAQSRISVPRATFDQAHPALQRRFVRWAVKHLGKADNLSYAHILSAIEVAMRGKLGAIAVLPDELRLRVDYEDYVIEFEDAPLTSETALLSGVEIAVNIPGTTAIEEGWVLHASVDVPSESEEVAARLEITPDSRVLLRARREGDFFAPLGIDGHTQKIGKWMIDHKIPRGLREAIPLLEVNGEIAAILWGSQWAVSEHYAVRHMENHVIYLWLESPN